MDTRVIAKVQGFGFDVYMRKPTDTWILFTDGKHIGHLQGGFGDFSCSTVHKPNRTTGTGFNVDRYLADFDKAILESCFAVAPSWATDSDRASVVKYRGMAEYKASGSFESEYQLVPAIES